MHAAPHRNNSDFQLRYFIAGSCHTADGAWAVLYNQKLDIEIKLATTKAQIIKREVRRLELSKRAPKNDLEAKLIEAEWIEFNSTDGLLELAVEGAEKELETIKSLMDEYSPHRKYGHLPILEATEAAQREEWLLEFKNRVENYLLTQGTIPHDQIEAMRQHPDFEVEIVPHIKNMMISISQAKYSVEAITGSQNSVLRLKGG
jgi:hypothetical protein